MRQQRTWTSRMIRASVLVVLAGTGITLALVALEWPSWQEKRRFAAVHLGMTEEEVLAVVGKPPGQYGPPGATYAGSIIFF